METRRTKPAKPTGQEFEQDGSKTDNTTGATGVRYQ
jgi:hypothetical protein